MGTRRERGRNKHKDPYDYERKLAQRSGGRREAASGAISGDMDVNHYSLNGNEPMIDAKRTDAKSFSIKLSHFRHIESRCDLGQIPMMAVNFNGEDYAVVVLKEEDFWALFNRAKDSTPPS
jgi:hypothetical protein